MEIPTQKHLLFAAINFGDAVATHLHTMGNPITLWMAELGVNGGPKKRICTKLEELK